MDDYIQIPFELLAQNAVMQDHIYVKYYLPEKEKPKGGMYVQTDSTKRFMQLRSLWPKGKTFLFTVQLNDKIRFFIREQWVEVLKRRIDCFDKDGKMKSGELLTQRSKEKFWTIMMYNMRKAAKHRGEKGRIQASECTLLAQDLKQLYEKQKGRCFYSGILMRQEQHVSWKASPERLNTEKGYVDGNVVLVCIEFNGFLQMNSERLSQMLQWSYSSDEISIPDDFVRSFWEAYKLRSASVHTVAELCSQFKLQKGRCYYSNIPLSLDHNNAYYRPYIVECPNDTFVLIIEVLWVSPLYRWSRMKFDLLRKIHRVRVNDYSPYKPIRRRYTRLIQSSFDDE